MHSSMTIVVFLLFVFGIRRVAVCFIMDRSFGVSEGSEGSFGLLGQSSFSDFHCEIRWTCPLFSLCTCDQHCSNEACIMWHVTTYFIHLDQLHICDGVFA